jgi:uncharacterized protein (DUF58 family)
MIPRELARKIRYIEITTSKAVNDVLAGEYVSHFKGRGMEFDEVREYQPGDDVRTIDWNVTARTGKPYVKRFVEERELTVVFLVDLSASGSFGSVEKTKNEVAAELCALLAFAAVKNNDRVGLVVFTDRVELFIPPGKGTTHALRLIRELLTFGPPGSRARRAGTDVAGALDFAGRVLHKRAVLFLVSDFQAAGYERPLRVMARRHDLIACPMVDRREVTLPDVGLLELEDAETGETALVDTSSTRVREAYTEAAVVRGEALRSLLRATGVDSIEIRTDRDYLRAVIRFFRSRRSA